jgi:hypothetical protein
MLPEPKPTETTEYTEKCLHFHSALDEYQSQSGSQVLVPPVELGELKPSARETWEGLCLRNKGAQ